MSAIEKQEVACSISPEKEVLAHEILERIADKWTLLVIDALETGGESRFSQLRQRVPGVSQKMLTKTLRQLERDGLVSRYVHASVPPRVDYKLTALGNSLGQSLCGVWAWMSGNLTRVESARRRYDNKVSPK
jgi:DNA-binding HxlR family transcriptional regulator